LILKHEGASALTIEAELNFVLSLLIAITVCTVYQIDVPMMPFLACDLIAVVL
jgi:hypothetical protein